MSPLKQLLKILDLQDAQAGGSPLSTFRAAGYNNGGCSDCGGEMPMSHTRGDGGGQDDVIPAMLAPGEYVFDADIVASLGDGSNEEGARRLDEFREIIRSHKRSAPADSIPPKARSPLAYMQEVG